MRLWQVPVVAAQALWIRTMAPVLPVAGGPNHGCVEAPGQPSYRLGVVGESTAAGAGVATHEQGIAGGLANAITARTQRRVEWIVFGAARSSVRRIRQKLVPKLPEQLDLAVLLAGFDDLLSGSPADDWELDMTATIEDLAVRNRHVLVTGIPPMSAMPGLPSPLAEHLDEQAKMMDAVTARLCAGRGEVTFVPTRGIKHTKYFGAGDGFHPSQSGYAYWAAELVRRIPM